MFAVACCATITEGQPPGQRSELTNEMLVGRGRATIHASKEECHVAELRRVMIWLVLVSSNERFVRP